MRNRELEQIARLTNLEGVVTHDERWTAGDVLDEIRRTLRSWGIDPNHLPESVDSAPAHGIARPVCYLCGAVLGVDTEGDADCPVGGMGVHDFDE